MKAMMALLISLLCVPVPLVYAYIQSVDSFKDIVYKIEDATPITMVVNANSCTPWQGTNRVTRAEKFIISHNVIKFADAPRVIINDPLHPDVPTLETVNYTLTSPNQLEINVADLSLPDYKIQESYTISCKLFDDMSKVFASV